MAIVFPISYKVDSSALKSAEGEVSGFGDKLKGLFTGFAVVGAITGVANFTKELVNAGIESDKSEKRVRNIASSMGIFGDKAGAVSDRILALAESQATLTGTDDDVIKGAQAKLLTFVDLAKTAGDVGGAFDRATLASQDLAAAGFGTTEGNATMLGKALQDPIKGVASLTRVGVTLTDSQKELIKSFVASGDAAGAQNVILSAVEQQVGGTAAATASASDKIKVAFDNIKQNAGQALLPAFNSVADGILTTVVPALNGFVSALPGIFSSIGSVLGPVLKPLVDGFKQLLPIFAPLIPQLLSLAGAFSPLQLILGVIAPLLPTIVGLIVSLAKVFAETLSGALTVILPPITDLIKMLSGTLTETIRVLMPIIADLAKMIGEYFAKGISDLAPLLAVIIQAFNDLLQPLLPLIPELLKLAFEVITPLLGLFMSLVELALPILTGLLSAIIPIITSVAGVLEEGLIIGVQGAIDVFNILMVPIKAVYNFFNDKIIPIVTVVGDTFQKVFQKVSDFVVGIFNGIRDTIKDAINGIIDTANNAIGTVNGFLKAGASVLHVAPLVIPSIPRLAEGGIVQPVPGGRMVTVAEAGQAEAIIPLNQIGSVVNEINDAAGGSRNQGNNTVVNVVVNAGMGADGMDIGRKIVTEIKKYERTNGAVWAMA